MSWFSEKWEDYIEKPVQKIIDEGKRLDKKLGESLGIYPKEVKEEQPVAATTDGATAQDISDIFQAQQQMIGSLTKLLQERDQPTSTVYVQPAATPAAAPNYLLYGLAAFGLWLMFGRKGKGKLL